VALVNLEILSSTELEEQLLSALILLVVVAVALLVFLAAEEESAMAQLWLGGFCRLLVVLLESLD